jgi:hypothetical protein
MAEIRTATTLRSKEAEIVRAIENYEKALVKARADLAHVRAVIALFDKAGLRPELATPYTNLRFIFSRAEMAAVCLAALTERAPQSTRELTHYVLRSKGLDASDKVLEGTTMLKTVQVMRRLERTGKAVEAGRQKAPRMILWALPEGETRTRL